MFLLLKLIKPLVLVVVLVGAYVLASRATGCLHLRDQVYAPAGIG